MTWTCLLAWCLYYGPWVLLVVLSIAYFALTSSAVVAWATHAVRVHGGWKTIRLAAVQVWDGAVSLAFIGLIFLVMMVAVVGALAGYQWAARVVHTCPERIGR